ncbi:MAG: hypothetical protein HGB06_02370 [Chlorobaculum sp.]|nr:hypothetical protein [Chlorobaculum sp.]
MKKNVLKQTLLPALLAIGMCAPVAASAGTGDIALGVKGGTAGLGGELTVGVLNFLNFRTGYNTFNYDGNDTQSDIDYDYKLKLQSIPLLVDLHPFGGGFRLTSGIFINNNEVTSTAKPNNTAKVNIGGTEYSIGGVGADLVSLDGKIDFQSTAPYLGIGWGNAVGKNSHLTIFFDAGIMFQGTPKVSLNANGPIASDATFEQKRAEEEAQLKNDIKDLQYYPILSLGLAYKF